MLLPQEAIDWFKLSKDPFSGELKSGKDVFVPRSVAIAEMRIWRAVDRQQMIALVGEVGSGKSTLMAKILEEMSRIKTFCIANLPSLGRLTLTPAQLADAVMVGIQGEKTWGSLRDKAEGLQTAFEEIEGRGQKVVLVIDEAHELPTPMIRDLKKLYELRGKFITPLALVLVGQMKLMRRLEREVTLKEVKDRMEIVRLTGFRHPKDQNMEEAIEYLTFKLGHAGGRKIEDIFTPDGLAMLLDHPAARHPLGINNLVSMSMRLAADKEMRERKINAEILTMSFVEVGYDGQVVEEDEGEPAERVA